MSEVRFRRMNFVDIEGVLVVERQCFSTPWSPAAFYTEMHDNDLAYYLVAEIDRQIIGYAGMWLIIDEAHVTNIAIAEGYRGQGIGELLVRTLMERAKEKGAESMTLEVRLSNKDAQRLYTKLGFVAKGVRHRYYSDNNEDAMIMWHEKI